MTNATRICVVGAGRAGQVHSGTLVNSVPEARLAALVDQNADALGKVGDHFNVEARFTSLEQALLDSVLYPLSHDNEPVELTLDRQACQQR